MLVLVVGDRESTAFARGKKIKNISSLSEGGIDEILLLCWF